MTSPPAPYDEAERKRLKGAVNRLRQSGLGAYMRRSRGPRHPRREFTPLYCPHNKDRSPQTSRERTNDFIHQASGNISGHLGSTAHGMLITETPTSQINKPVWPVSQVG